MKLKSLILGSVAAAGLSTAGYAADLGVLTSLDVCDSLGISGLTLSSTDNCLAITGNVSYEFSWGDYNDAPLFAVAPRAGVFNILDNTVGVPATADNDWNSKVEAWIQFVGSSSTDFGRASATIKLKSVSQTTATNEVLAIGGDATNGGAAGGNGIVILDEAFVQVGDTTTIMAGKKSSIANFGDDEPLNFLALFNSEKVDKGVMFAKDGPRTGGHVIQVVSAVADGVTVKAGLENLDGRDSPAFAGYYDGYTGAQAAGTLVGVVEYAGNGIKAHVTGLAGGVLDGVVDNWAAHAGIQGSFDMISVLAAGAVSGNGYGDTYWNVLGSAKATFDIFEIALSGEANGGYNGGGIGGAVGAVPNQYGAGGSVGVAVTEGVKINLGGRWFDSNADVANTEGYQVAAQIVAAVTETITVTGEVGVYGNNTTPVPAIGATDFYGAAQLEWKPGGGFTSSLRGEGHQTGAYKVTFKAAKEFK
jgi:hypothetical protein